MNPKPILALGAAALLVAMAVFELKRVVRERERELAALERAIDAERARIRTLRADLAWLTRPERIAAQARQLGLEPARVERLVRAEDLPDATALLFAGRSLTVELDTGQAVELRFKPLAGWRPAAGRTGGP